MAKRGAARSVENSLRAFALGLPEAKEEFPWGQRVIKVRGKIFLFLGGEEEGLSLSVKLPGSATFALDLPFATPTAYGLGKSGWVTARFAPGDDVPLPLLRQWVDESYRAIAPQRLAATLGDSQGPQPARPAKPKRRAGPRG